MNSLKQIPAPSDRRIALRVKPAAERALRAGHPWLFDGAIVKQSHEGLPGDLAVIFDRKNRFVAIGLYDPESSIRVRILQHGRPATINQDWFKGKITQAATKRANLLDSGTTGYRLLHGENDGFPGLIIDCYDGSYVLKLYTIAWLPHLAHLLSALLAIAPVERIVLRLNRSLKRSEDSLFSLYDGQLLFGRPLDGPVFFQENSLLFEADLVKGQKTGFFLDQRDNRQRLESLVAADRRLNRVLNVFAYTGGFSLYAARGGARKVVSLDSGRAALEAATRNFALNQANPIVAAVDHETIAADAFEVLSDLKIKGRTFDVVIIDPPAFAKSRDEVGQGLKGYRRLLENGLELLRPDGLMVMSSCSSQIGSELFFKTVYRKAIDVERPLKEIARTGHPIDHPVCFPQGEYLKCLFALAP